MTKLPRRTSAKRALKIDPTKLGKLLRLLASDKDGEVIAAASALKRTLGAAGLDLHDLAAAAERGLRPQQQQPLQQLQRQSWDPPLPAPDDWQAMAWYCHFHRHQLRNDQRERVADYLLGTAFSETDDRCMPWHLDELRALVARVRAELRSTSVVRP
jgi:hypothetical protein